MRFRVVYSLSEKGRYRKDLLPKSLKLSCIIDELNKVLTLLKKFLSQPVADSRHAGYTSQCLLKWLAYGPSKTNKTKQIFCADTILWLPFSH